MCFEIHRAGASNKPDLRVVARLALGLLGTLFFLAVGFMAFGHKCMAGNNWSEGGRATSVGNSDTLGRPHRSVLALALS